MLSGLLRLIDFETPNPIFGQPAFDSLAYVLP
jgi:hypothetical protein